MGQPPDEVDEVTLGTSWTETQRKDTERRREIERGSSHPAGGREQRRSSAEEEAEGLLLSGSHQARLGGFT